MSRFSREPLEDAGGRLRFQEEDGVPHAEVLIPPIDERIQGFWDPIPVSPNTVETTTEFPGDCEEVDCPADAFGASLSVNFYFEP